MWKVIYLIPWFTEQITDDRYNFLVEFLKNQKTQTIPIIIDWKYKVMSDYVQECKSQMNRHTEHDTVYTLWFSFGAVISYIVSAHTNFISTQYLCSLSPYFQEDLDSIPERRKKIIGKNRIHDFQSLSSSRLAKNIFAQTYLLYWKKEPNAVEVTSKRVSKEIKKSNIISIPWAKHDISQDVYSKQIELLLSKSFLS